MIAMRLVLSSLLALTLAACGSARVSQFDSFAAAGVKFSEALPAVYDQSFEASVKSDSFVLLEARAKLPQADRARNLDTSNENLRARLAILTDLKTHSATLKAYFVALKALASSDEASGITQATKDLTATLGKLDSDITKKSIGKLPINEFIGQAVPIVVAQYKSSALNAELKERAGAIERELNLQEASLAALSKTMKSDLGVEWDIRDRDEIDIPFIKAPNLPSDWNEKRLQAFRRKLELGTVDAAASAARNLRLSYIALVENRLDESAMSLLVSDLNKLVTLLEGVKGKP
jgi:hypothetical protein